MTSPEANPALIIARYGARVDLLTHDETTLNATLRKSCRDAACGDKVSWHWQNAEAVVSHILERETLLRRVDPYSKTRTLAANVSQMIIVIAPKPECDWFLLDQLLMTVHDQAMQALIVANKTDLAHRSVTDKLAYYESLGYRGLHCSVKTERGLNQLRQSMNGHCNIVVGQSGVGKSSLINQIVDDDHIVVGSLAEKNEQGRHTTSVSRCYRLDEHSLLIDSPGIREFTPENFTAETVHRGFADIARIAQRCRFSDCAHRREPGCAVVDAASAGILPLYRLDHFQRLLASAAV